MRGSDEKTGSLFSYVDLEARIRKDHPLRTIWSYRQILVTAEPFRRRRADGRSGLR